MNVSGLFKLSSLDSISQYGTLQQIINNASSLYRTQLTGKKPNSIQQLSKLIEQKSISTT